jgi:hypothetical protein
MGSSQEFDFGVDLFYDKKFNGEIDYYYKRLQMLYMLLFTALFKPICYEQQMY